MSKNKIISNIMNKVDVANNLKLYVNNAFLLYNNYSTIKMSMNLYTLREIIEEKEQDNSNVAMFYNELQPLLEKVLLCNDRECVYDKLQLLRNNITSRMTTLTAFTDAFEIYEYVLNRKEAAIFESVEEVDIEKLADEMFGFVFQDKQNAYINSKIQMLVAQLPIRMTKNRFYDLVSNTLMIYKGGEESAVRDFVNMLIGIIDFSGISDSKEQYPNLYNTYCTLKNEDYKNLTKESFLSLFGALKEASAYLSYEVSDFMLLQEVVNDLLVITLSNQHTDDINNKAVISANKILKDLIQNKNLLEIIEEDASCFEDIEGAQEDVYSQLVGYEAVIYDITKDNEKDIIDNNLQNNFNELKKCDSLVSTSLFVELDYNKQGNGNIADNKFIVDIQNELICKFKAIFEECSIDVTRSIMSKVLAVIPVFFNTQQEIKDYFITTLNKCTDESELTACAQVIKQLMY